MMISLNHYASCLFSLAILLQVLTPTDAAAYITEPTCTSFTFPDTSTRELCYTASGTSPSPVAFENGTISYSGGSSVSYVFMNELAGLSISVFWDDGTCTVTVGDKTCNSCDMCDDSGAFFSADCTNVRKRKAYKGRSVTCEATGPVFFPLSLALKKFLW